MNPYSRIISAVAGTIVYPPKGRYGPRIQQDVQLVLLHTGEMTVEIDGNRLEVNPGSVVLLTPGHHELFTFSEHAESWHRWISVRVDKPEKVDEWMGEMKSLPRIQPISEAMNRMTDLMLSIQSREGGNQDVLRSVGMAAVQLYADELSRIRSLEQVHSSVVKVKELIHHSFAEELTLNRLAEHGSVSPEHLVRLFRLHENTTPIKYVWKYRVLRALELLGSTGLSIAEISSRCGFKSTFHFARMVKQQTGKTPSEMRTSYWNGWQS